MPSSIKRHRQHVSHWSSAGSLNSFGESLQHASSGTVPSSQGSGSNCPQETLQNRFQIIRTLGKGTYGKVKLACDRGTSHYVAIKTIRKSRIENPHDLQRMWREINFMSNLSHPHIIKIKEVYESREKIILVMEYASNGELYEYLNRVKRIPETEARAIFRQIVSAVHFLHKSHIVHRDLKLENILIDEHNNIKLADFGLSNNWMRNRLLYTFCGSPLYASPEIVNGIPYYGPEVDCWSLGVLLYTLVYGSMPFQGGDYARLVKNISSGTFIQPREKSGAFSLIQRCLCVNPAKRASIDETAEHWWVNFGFKNLPIVYSGSTALLASNRTLSTGVNGTAAGSLSGGVSALGQVGPGAAVANMGAGGNVAERASVGTGHQSSNTSTTNGRSHVLSYLSSPVHHHHPSVRGNSTNTAAFSGGYSARYSRGAVNGKLSAVNHRASKGPSKGTVSGSEAISRKRYYP